MATLACGWWVEAEGTDDHGTGTRSTGSETATGGAGSGMLCPGQPGVGAPLGRACTGPEECQSGCCEVFSEAPQAIGTCVDAPSECEMRSVGRVLSFPSRKPAPGIDTWIIGAVDVANGPNDATPLGRTVSDERGLYDVTTDEMVDVPFGVAVLLQGDGHYPTIGGLAAPYADGRYITCPLARDMWALPSVVLASYNQVLVGDPDVAPYLPLGAQGGILGIVRWIDTGEPATGAQVVPVAADSSDMVIRYLDDSGTTFVDDRTHAPGVFLLVGALPGEEFDVVLQGAAVHIRSKDRMRAGPTKGAVFTISVNVVDE
jgi:hypothetical protein